MDSTLDLGSSQCRQADNDSSSGQRENAGRKPAERPALPPGHWLVELARSLLGLSVFDVMEIAPDEAAVEDLCIRFRWPEGVVCPMSEKGRCSGTAVHEVGTNKRPKRFFCNECVWTFNARSEATPKSGMHGSHLPFLVWIWAMYFKANTQGLKLCEMTAYLGVSKRTAQRLYRLLPGPLRKGTARPLPVPLKESQQPDGFDPGDRPLTETPEAPPPPAERGSVLDLMGRCRTDMDYDRWLIDTLYPDGMKCPSETQNCAGSPVRELPAKRGLRTLRFQCGGCGRRFTSRTNTVMRHSPLPSRVWVWAAYFVTNTSVGISSSRLARYLGIRRATAHHLTHRLREGMQEIAPPLMSGVVEADESVWSFRHVLGRPRLYTVVLRCRDTGKVHVVTVLARTKVQLHTIIARHIAKGTTVYTDGWAGYDGLENAGYAHESVVHKDNVYARESMVGPDGPGDKLVVHVNGAESLNGRQRRSARGVYRRRYSPHHMVLYHMQDAFLHNHRGLPAFERMRRAVSQTVGRRLTLGDLRQARTRLNELVSMCQLGDDKVLVMLDRYACWMLSEVQPLLLDVGSLPPSDKPPNRPKRPKRVRRPLPGNRAAIEFPGFAQLLQPDDRGSRR